MSVTSAQKSPYQNSLMEYWFRQKLEREISGHLHEDISLDGDSLVDQACSYLSEILDNRNAYEMALYTDYLESWIQGNPDWRTARPIPFSRFEFINNDLSI